MGCGSSKKKRDKRDEADRRVKEVMAVEESNPEDVPPVAAIEPLYDHGEGGTVVYGEETVINDHLETHTQPLDMGHEPPPPTATPRRGILKEKQRRHERRVVMDDYPPPPPPRQRVEQKYDAPPADYDQDGTWDNNDDDASDATRSPSSLATRELYRRSTAGEGRGGGGRPPRWNTSSTHKKQIWQSDYASDYYF